MNWYRPVSIALCSFWKIHCFNTCTIMLLHHELSSKCIFVSHKLLLPANLFGTLGPLLNVKVKPSYRGSFLWKTSGIQAFDSKTVLTSRHYHSQCFKWLIEFNGLALYRIFRQVVHNDDFLRASIFDMSVVNEKLWLFGSSSLFLDKLFLFIYLSKIEPNFCFIWINWLRHIWPLFKKETSYSTTNILRVLPDK